MHIALEVVWQRWPLTVHSEACVLEVKCDFRNAAVMEHPTQARQGGSKEQELAAPNTSARRMEHIIADLPTCKLFSRNFNDATNGYNAYGFASWCRRRRVREQSVASWARHHKAVQFSILERLKKASLYGRACHVYDLFRLKSLLADH